MITYHRRALKALAFLFRPYNDIDVYVEDKVIRNVYEVILTRLLANRARVTRIFSLGGRTEVIEAARRAATGGNRCELYLIDGDLDLLKGVSAPEITGLYRLNVYCAENLVLCPDACVEVAYEVLADTSKQALAVR